MFCSAGGNGTSHGSSRDRIVGSVLFGNFSFFSFSSALQFLSFNIQMQPIWAAFCIKSSFPDELAVFGSLLSGFGSLAGI